MWPTPTPIPTPVATPNFPLNPPQITGQVADGIVQGWNTFNASPVATVFWIITLLIIIYFGVMSIRAHLEKL